MSTPKQTAQLIFDEWNDVTGFVVKGTSYYAEICSLMSDAYLAGHASGFREGVEQAWAVTFRAHPQSRPVDISENISALLPPSEPGQETSR